MNIIINVGNLHVGGGVQVASSFLTELSYLLDERKIPGNISISVLCSDVVNDNLPKNFNYHVFDSFSLINIYGFKKPKKDILNLFEGYDTCFTLFGPLYFKPRTKKHVCGFAQAWICYPNNLAFSNLSIVDKIKSFFKYELQWFYFNKSNRLIVEQRHVKNALVTNRNYSSERVDIVENCVSSVFFLNEKEWTPIKNLPFNEDGVLTLGFLGRAYSHKNLAILSSVNNILISKYKLNARFVFTLNEEEMRTLEFDKISNFYTVGSLNIDQCPTFYQLIDALVFPSLLECYSATPIEAMLMKVPVFASELPFVKDVCKDKVFYFDPLDPESIAESIYYGFNDSALLNHIVEDAFSHAIVMPNARERALKYLELIIG